MKDLFNKTEMFRGMLEDCNEKLLRQPGNAKVLMIRGLLLNVLQSYQDAIADLTKIIDSNPNDFQAFYLRSDSHFNSKDYLLAKQDYMRALREQFHKDDPSLKEKFSEERISEAAIEYEGELEKLKEAIDKEKELLLFQFNFNRK